MQESENNNIRLQISGRLSNDILKKYLKEFWEGEGLLQGHVVLFCGRSSFDIPISEKFNLIIVDGKIEYRGEFLICNITQQFFKKFDCIPTGWLTICEFKFKSSLPQAILNLPSIDSWYDSRTATNVFFE